MATRLFCWRRIAAIDNLLDSSPALGRRQRTVLLDAGRFRRQIVVFDRIPEPLRVGARAQVMEPCLIVDAYRELQEGRKVLRTQVESSARPAEIEALVLTKFAFGIFADMARLLFPWLQSGDQLNTIFSQHQDLTLPWLFQLWTIPACRLTEFRDRLRCPLAHPNHRRDQLQKIGSDLLRMNGDRNRSRQLLRQRQWRGIPFSRQAMMDLIEHEPMRTPRLRPHLRDLG